MGSSAGLCDFEVTSFVSPKWVPQMADHAEIIAARQIPRAHLELLRVRAERARPATGLLGSLVGPGCNGGNLRRLYA